MAQGKQPTAWVITASMGYGHWRAAYPFLPHAEGGRIIAADNYDGIPATDRLVWRQSERFYNFVSRLAAQGPLGRLAFSFFDRFQRVSDFNLHRKDFRPTFQLRGIYRAIRRGWGRDLIDRIGKNPIPIITPFFPIAYMAEEWKYPGPIILVVTDADVSRAWAPYEPSRTRIRYCVPTERAVSRLESYGVPTERIFLTGFPLQPPFKGGRNLKENLIDRIRRLDPLSSYRKRDRDRLQRIFGVIPQGRDSSSEILFSLGGAGAQISIGAAVIERLADRVRDGSLRLYFGIGGSSVALQSFEDAARRSSLYGFIGERIILVSGETPSLYIEKFNEALSRVDVLWTKPSELSFYAAYGLPIIIAPPIGSHELRNREWLLRMGAGIDQGDLANISEWLEDVFQTGKLAEAAVCGFEHDNRNGLDNILKVAFKNFNPNP